MNHLDALNLRLSHERVRLANAKSDKERALRTVWVEGIEKEIAAEKVFLGIADEPESKLTLDEILTELDNL